MKIVVFLVLCLCLGAGVYIYFEKPELVNSLMGSQPGQQQAAPDTAPVKKLEPDRPESNRSQSKAKPQQKSSVEEKNPEPVKPRYKLSLPETDLKLFVNGEPAAPNQTLELDEPEAVVVAYRDNRYSHEVLTANESPVAARLQTRTLKPTKGWSTYQGNGLRTGFVETANRGSLKARWSVDLDDKVQSSPLIVNGMAYTSGEQHKVIAISMSNGKVLWKKEGSGGVANPIVNSRFVFMGNHIGQIDGFRIKDGKARGAQQLGSYPTATTLVTDEEFLVVTRDSRVHALSAKKGFAGRAPLKVRWEADLPELGNSTAAPVLVGDRAILQTESEGLLALNMADGRKLWPSGGSERSDPAAMQASFMNAKQLFLPTPASDGETVYAAMERSLVAVNARDGKELWRKPLDVTVSSSLSLAYGTLYYGTGEGGVEARSSVDGSLIFQLNPSKAPIFAAPVIFYDKLLVGGGGGKIFLYNCFTGDELDANKELAGASIDATPAVVSDAILVVNRSGKMVCFQ